MAAAVTNPQKLTWGSYEIGGSTERLIVGIHRQQETNTTWSITLDVLIRGSSDAAFAAACAELESEFTKRRQRILWQLGSATEKDANPTGNLILNSFAQIDKVGTPGADSDRSRLYTVTLGGEKPATDTSGRRDVTMTIEYDGSRIRTVTFSGVWTALTSNGALAQYEAQIASYCSSALGALTPSATFEVTKPERIERDDQDDLVRFTRTYRQVPANQPGGSPDSAAIVDPQVIFSKAQDATGDSGGGKVRRLDVVTARFECEIDITQTTNIKQLWEATVLPWIKSQFVSAWAPSDWGIGIERCDLIPFTNRLVGEVQFHAAINATDVVQSVVTSTFEGETGLVFTGAWNGDPDAFYVDQGKRNRRRIGIKAVRVLGTIKPNELFGEQGGTLFGISFAGGGSVSRTGQGSSSAIPPGGAFESDPVFGGNSPAGGGLGAAGGQKPWRRLAWKSDAIPRWIGKPGEEQIAVTDLVEMTVERYASDPDGSSSGPGVRFGPGGEVPAGGVLDRFGPA